MPPATTLDAGRGDPRAISANDLRSRGSPGRDTAHQHGREQSPERRSISLDHQLEATCPLRGSRSRVFDLGREGVCGGITAPVASDTDRRDPSPSRCVPA